MNFAKRLKDLREEQGLSQMGLAKATGISQSSIARWELEKADPTASALITLAVFSAKASTIYWDYAISTV